MEPTNQTPIAWERIADVRPGAKTYAGTHDFRLILIIEKHAPEDGGRWHLTMSHTHRYPTLDELADARHKLIPDNATMVLLTPPPREHRKFYDTCLELWEIQPEQIKHPTLNG